MLPLPRGAVWQMFFLLCAVLLANEVRSEGRVVCYYTNWSVYRPGAAKYNPQNINPYLCTHLVYAFGGFTKDNTMKPFDKYQDIEQGGYAKFTGLKTYNKQLKTMIAIGGWNEASSRFSPLVASSERRQQFIKNILKFLRQNHFDGIDLDWEYPAHREGGKPRDKDNYAQFVQELRAEFDRESAKTGRPRLLLTMAVPAGIQYIEKGYDIPKLNQYLDWFNLLTYDFHSSHEPSANHHAPLYSLEEDDEYNFDTELNIDYSIKYYLNAGADRDKLVLGIPTYGRSYTLINEDSTDIGAPSEGPGEQGDATREKGYLAYYEICQNIKDDPDWTVVQPNPAAMGPYAYKGNLWVGYDDEAIVRKKAEYVVENGLGGIMFWAIDNDDFRGTCTGKPYPLIEAAKEAYLDRLGVGDNEVAKPASKKKPLRSRTRIGSSNRNKVEKVVEKAVAVSQKRTSTTKRPQSQRRTTTSTTTTTTGSSLYIGGRTTTPEPPTTPDPGSDFKCEDEGFFQHPRDCKKYFWCLDSGPSDLGIVAHQFTCPSGLYFNPAADSCDFARNVPCNKNPKDPPSTTSRPTTTTTTTTTARTTTASSRITAATSRNSFIRFTSTTTQAPEDDDEEYEDEEDGPVIPESEEDPKVIKELIDLIKKVGGIEELEKHLLQQEDGTVMFKKDDISSVGLTTTPPSISKSLYDKVLSRPNNLSAFRNKFTSSTLFRSTSKPKPVEESEEEEEEEEVVKVKSNSGSKYSSVVRNSRPGPQNAGIDKLPEFEGFLKEKKKYVTIQRTKPLLVSSDEVSIEEDQVKNTLKDSDDEDEDNEDANVKISSRRPSSSSTPAYTSIRRTKSTTVKPDVVEENLDDDDLIVDKKTYTPLNRNRVRSTPADIETTTVAGNRYKFLERTRPTRRPAAPVTVKEDVDEESNGSDDELSVTVQYTDQNEISTQTSTPTPQVQTTTIRAYASLGRRTTATPSSSTTTTTTTDQFPTETTTPESFVIDTTTTPEPIIITTTTTTTTTTNPIPIETSTQSLTINPIPAISTSTLDPTSTSQDADELVTIFPKIPNTLATESGLDTQEIDSTQNQILTETTTIDDTNRNEVTNLSTKAATTRIKSQSQSSLNINSSSTSSSNSIRGTLNNKFPGGGRRQKTTTTSSIDTNQQDQESSTTTSTNEFLGTVSSPRPFGFPRRRTRPTTTTTTATTIVAGGVDDAASSTANPSDASTQLVKKRVQFNRTAGRRRPNTTTPITTTTTTTTRTTTLTQVNPSIDDVNVIDSTSSANLGLTSERESESDSENGTTEDIETGTSTEVAPKPRRRFRILKFKRPLNVNNSLSVEINNSTNTATVTSTTQTSGSTLGSVDNNNLGLDIGTNNNNNNTHVGVKRFRKVIRRLRPVANRTTTTTETTAVLDETTKPLNVAEFINQFSENPTTAASVAGATEISTDEDDLTTTLTPDTDTAFDTTISALADNEVTSEAILSESTTSRPVPPTPRRLLINRRPYRPTKPSINAITSTDSSSSIATQRTYVRKFNRNFKAIRPPSDSANGIGFIEQASGRPQTEFVGRNRFNFPTRTTTQSTRLENQGEEDADEEDYDEATNVNQDEDERVEGPVIRPNVQFSLNQVHSQTIEGDNHEEDTEVNDAENESTEDSEEEDVEEDEEDDQSNKVSTPAPQVIYRPTRPSNRPSFNRPANTPFVPNRPSAAVPANRFPGRAQNKTRVVNRPTLITLPPNLLDSDKPTVTASITPPSVFISTNTRSYERKYSASSTEAIPQEQSNPLLEDLNIDALNARNKKIFETNSKKHTTIKPKLIQNQPQPDTTDTPTNSFDTSTVFEEDIEDNNLINSQEASEQTTTVEGITDQPTPAAEGELILYSPKQKLVTINRVVEVNSKEDKLRRKSKDEMLQTVESTHWRAEGMPKLEALGEISRVKYVHLVDGSKILVDGRSSVTDYTPTESSVFVRNNVPEVPLDSLESTRIDYEPGSTSAPYRNSIPDMDYSSSVTDAASDERKSKAITVPQVIVDVIESSTISLEGLFDAARQAKKINDASNEVNGIFYAYSLGEVPTTPRNEKPKLVSTTESTSPLTTTTTTTSTTTPTPTTTTTTTETPETTTTTTTSRPTPTTTAPSQPPSTTESAADTTTESTTAPVPAPLVSRPLIPLLRPESNEFPLVISIANLDKVILSKVVKPDSNSAQSVRQESVIDAPVQDSPAEVLQASESGGISSSHSSSNSIETKIQTETSFSSETHVVKRKKPSKRKHKSRHHKRPATTLSSSDVDADEVATTLAP